MSTGALIVVAASGGLGALIAGLITAWVNSRNARRSEDTARQHWLRSERLRTYSELMGAINYAVQVSLHKPQDLDERLKAMKAMSYAIGPAFVFADRATETLMQRLWNDTYGYLNAPNDELMDRLKVCSAQLRAEVAATLGVDKGDVGFEGGPHVSP